MDKLNSRFCSKDNSSTNLDTILGTLIDAFINFPLSSLNSDYITFLRIWWQTKTISLGKCCFLSIRLTLLWHNDWSCIHSLLCVLINACSTSELEILCAKCLLTIVLRIKCTLKWYCLNKWLYSWQLSVENVIDIRHITSGSTSAFSLLNYYEK